MRVLAGDIGGTKVNLAIYRQESGNLHCERQQSFASRGFSSVESVVAEFLRDEDRSLDGAVLGVAGRVVDGRAHLTNLGWNVDARVVQQAVGSAPVTLLNDLEASAYGVLALEAEERIILNRGKPRVGTMALLAAGTGLGEGLLWWDGKQHRPAPSEGGHSEFAPRNDLEIDLLVYLRQKFDHVSYERILTGAGLFNVYCFLRDSGRGEESDELAQRLGLEDPAAVISSVALAGGAAICLQALDIFVSIYGAEAGNLALKVLPDGGLYVAGGIAPKIRAKMEDGTFIAAFLDKGRMRPLLERIPVYLVCAQDMPMRGAAVCALRQLGG